jgi:hypothetical protein
MEQLWHYWEVVAPTLGYVYGISAIGVALLLLWIYDQVMTEMHVEKAIVTVCDWWAWYLFLAGMIFCPVLNTLIVLYALDCYRPKFST